VSRVVVIGGGIGGLASAALLARAGHEVTLLESHATLGGRAGSWEKGGFRFDTGPSWYLMPEVFDHFYRLLGTSAAEQLELVTLDPGYRAFFEGVAEPIDVSADRDENIDLFETVRRGSGIRLARYLRSASVTYELAKRNFLYTTFQSFRPMLTDEVITRLPKLAGLLLTSLWSKVARTVWDDRLRKILAYPAVFLGASPYSAPSMYHLMSHLDLADGVRYPIGGFARVIESIANLAVAEGVTVIRSATATRIVVEDGAAKGVEYRDEHKRKQVAEADIVVSGIDLHFSETELLEPEHQTFPEEYWAKATPGPSAVLLYLGVKGDLPELEHHNLLFAEDWRADLRRRATRTDPAVAVRVQAEWSGLEGCAGRPRESLRARSDPGRCDVWKRRRRRQGRQGSGVARGRGDRANCQLGGHPRSRVTHHGSPHGRSDRFCQRTEFVAGHRAGPGSHPPAERDVPGEKREQEGRRPLFRRRFDHSWRWSPDVPDQCGAGAQANHRRSVRRSATRAAGAQCHGTGARGPAGSLMAFLYLAALVVALAGMVVLDRRFRLFFWRSPARAAIVLAVGLAFFLVWDLQGIRLGIFFRGETSFMTGWQWTPELPLEEPFFLLLLCYLTMNVYSYLTARFAGRSRRERA
jgi:phytoene desaturase